MSSRSYTTGMGGEHAALNDFLKRTTSGMSHGERLAQARWLARLLDDQFVIPGIGFRFGWDAVIGLVPGIGDVVSTAISLLIINHAWQAGAGPVTLTRMLGNVGVDFLVGAVPVVGDVFDAAWKANRKNLRLLERHLERQARKQIR